MLNSNYGEMVAEKALRFGIILATPEVGEWKGENETKKLKLNVIFRKKKLICNYDKKRTFFMAYIREWEIFFKYSKT